MWLSIPNADGRGLAPKLARRVWVCARSRGAQAVQAGGQLAGHAAHAALLALSPMLSAIRRRCSLGNR